MEIKVGRCYRANDGSIHGPLQYRDDETYLFEAGGHEWTEEGLFYARGRKPAPLDLISEVFVLDKPPGHAETETTVTCRDRFAIAALQGILAHHGTQGIYPEPAAGLAMVYANAMIAVRKEKP